MRAANQSLVAQARARLEGATLIVEFGVLEGDPAHVFGRIQDVAMDSHDNIWVLDSRFNDVRAFNREGQLLQRFGRPGQGPGEFQAPQALELLNDTVLVVADRYSTLIWVTLTAGTLREERRTRLDFVPEDLCAIGERIFLQGHRGAERIIHEVDHDSIVRSFGNAYRSPDELVRRQLSDARIGCSTAGPRVLMILELFPWLHGYDTQGDLQWTSIIPDFATAEIESGMEDDGRPYVQQGGSMFDVAGRMTAFDRGVMLLQIDRHTSTSARERRQFDHTRTFVVDAISGALLFASARLPAIHSASDRLLVGVVNDSVPRVRIYAF